MTRRPPWVVTLDMAQFSNEELFEMLRSGVEQARRPGPDPLGLLFRRSMLWRAERQARSAWIEHVPFAFWLVDVLRPAKIVELGTHSGVSYSAMCQAVKSLGLVTSCFAIDTWRGDRHAGFYPEDIYNEFAGFNARHYSAFSRLVRSTFDDALSHFGDGTIDLLHIDGFHTYEAVKHDYETWLPKLSRNAVMLLHDTNVREGDFAVHRLWDEIAWDRLHFEFMHGHGLGILTNGDNYPEPLNILFEARGNETLTADIRSMFAYLGGFIRDSTELTLGELDARNAEAHRGALNRPASIIRGSARRILAWPNRVRNTLLRALLMSGNGKAHRK